jgi:hypothetical protein
MHPVLRLTAAAAAAFTLAGAMTAAHASSHYSAGFAMTSGNLSVLRTGNPMFDGDRTFTGSWTDGGTPHARTLTTDLASYSVGAGGAIVPVWGAFGYDENRGIGGLGPLSFGESHAFGCGLPGGACASGSYTASSASIFHDGMAARVTVNERAAQVDTEAMWSRGFSLDAGASFTFSGLATVGITGDDALIGLGQRVSTDSDAWMTVSSFTFGDALGRARTTLGASVWGANSVLTGISYLLQPDGLMSMTITNNSGAALLGRINAGSYVDLSPPIPEPATSLMLAAGAALVAGAARRRGRPAVASAAAAAA